MSNKRVKDAYESDPQPRICPGANVAGRVSRQRLERAKFSFNTRRVKKSDISFLTDTSVKPEAGDLVLARIQRLGQHTRIQTQEGRRSRLYVDDEVVLAYGNRYAVDQFEALIPCSLKPCHMVAAGGIAAAVRSSHSRMKRATRIEPIGLLLDQDHTVLNLKNWSIDRSKIPHHRQAIVIAVVGTEMNAGKTTTAASIIKGAARSGMRVAAAKVTGTGAANDFWEMSDAGALRVLDFVDAGYPTTYKMHELDVQGVFETLVANLLEVDPEVIVLELADGILQGETAALMSRPSFRRNVDSVVLAAGDSVAAAAGVNVLKQMKMPIAAIAGTVTASELGCRAATQATDFPVFGKKALCDPATLPLLLPRLGLASTG